MFCIMLDLDPPYNTRELNDIAIYIGDSNFGKGVFAKVALMKGDRIFRFGGIRISLDESIALGEDESYSVQIGLKEYLQPFSPGMYVNHSCEPNCGLTGAMFLIALRDIQIGEELFFDYSTTMLERRWEMQCNCRTTVCRHHIRDFDTLPQYLQKHCESLGIVQPFILNYLDSHLKDRRKTA